MAIVEDPFAFRDALLREELRRFPEAAFGLHLARSVLLADGADPTTVDAMMLVRVSTVTDLVSGEGVVESVESRVGREK